MDLEEFLEAKFVIAWNTVGPGSGPTHSGLGCADFIVAGSQEGLEEHPTLKVRKGGGEEIPLIQGKEQQLRFAGAAMERYLMPKVGDTQVRR